MVEVYPIQAWIRIFKAVEVTIRRDSGRKEKNKGEELIWVIIHICREMSQWNAL
jgi:hypothetical protein